MQCTGRVWSWSAIPVFGSSKHHAVYREGVVLVCAIPVFGAVNTMQCTGRVWSWSAIPVFGAVNTMQCTGRVWSWSAIPVFGAVNTMQCTGRGVVLV